MRNFKQIRRMAFQGLVCHPLLIVYYNLPIILSAHLFNDGDILMGVGVGLGAIIFIASCPISIIVSSFSISHALYWLAGSAILGREIWEFTASNLLKAVIMISVLSCVLILILWILSRIPIKKPRC